MGNNILFAMDVLSSIILEVEFRHCCITLQSSTRCQQRYLCIFWCPLFLKSSSAFQTVRQSNIFPSLASLRGGDAKLCKSKWCRRAERRHCNKKLDSMQVQPSLLLLLKSVKDNADEEPGMRLWALSRPFCLLSFPHHDLGPRGKGNVHSRETLERQRA